MRYEAFARSELTLGPVKAQVPRHHTLLDHLYCHAYHQHNTGFVSTMGLVTLMKVSICAPSIEKARHSLIAEQILFLPAIIAGAIYGILAYIVVPLYQQHYARYSQYLPLSAISSRTTSFRHTVGSVFSRLILPASMRWRAEVTDARRGSSSGDEFYFGEEEGESMVGFDVERRERLVRGGNVSVGMVVWMRLMDYDRDEVS